MNKKNTTYQDMWDTTKTLPKRTYTYKHPHKEDLKPVT